MEEIAAVSHGLHHGVAFLKPGLADIAVVLLATSLIERVLRMSLISGFRASVTSKTLVANVFEGKGPLATFSAKIDVCTGLGNIVGDARHDLKIINTIRNGFAHSPTELHLSDYTQCRSLRVTSAAVAVEPDECLERQMFKRSCIGIIAQACFGSLVRIAQHRFLEANDEGVRREYDAMIRSIDSSEAPSE